MRFSIASRRYLHGSESVVLGQPGSGKSSASRYIVKLAHRQGVNAIRLNDYNILQEMFKVDVDHKNFRPTEFGGFDVLKFEVLDIALRKIEEKVRKRMGFADLVIIEFARDDYGKALKQFSKDFLRESYFLFIDTNMKACIQRIHKRVAYPTTEDDHFVSENILRCYYSKQYIPPLSTLKSDYSIVEDRFKIIGNKGTRRDFDRKIHRFADIVFDREAHILFKKYSWQNVVERINQAFNGTFKKAPHPIAVEASRS